MRRAGVRSILLAFAIGAGVLGAGCSGSDGGTPAGTGGSTAGTTGGSHGAGGTAGGGDATGGHGGTAGNAGAGGVLDSGSGGTGQGGRTTGSGGAAGAGTGSGGRAGAGGDGAGGAAGTGAAAGTGGSAGAAGSAGAGGAGPNAAYNPCPTNGTACKILPFGDSITRGVKSSDDAGYRSQLFKLIVAAKQKVTFTGSLTNGPTQVSGQTFPRMHEGHPGWTIDPGYNTSGNYGGISSLVPSPALDDGPQIILLHIGTNDVFARDTANMSTRLEALIDKIAQNAPSALIVLAQITPLSTTNAALTAYNAKIPGVVQSHAAKGQHIIGVDMSKLPAATDLSSDGTHPNDQGYAYMASIWYDAIKQLLPK